MLYKALLPLPLLPASFSPKVNQEGKLDLSFKHTVPAVSRMSAIQQSNVKCVTHTTQTSIEGIPSIGRDKAKRTKASLAALLMR